MSQGIVETIGGAALIAAGALIEVGTLGGGTALAGFLISAGAGMLLSGVGTMLSQGPLQGFATATRNPVAPWEVVYGRKRVGGSIIFLNSFGDNDKYLDLVMVLAAHPSQSVDALLFDQQRIQMVTTGPGRTSVTPTQQNVVIADIKRVGNVVTVKTVGDIPSLIEGDQVIIQQVPGDPTLNGKYPVAHVVHGGGYVQFTYLCGGPASHVVSAGHVLTTWVDYGTKVYMETLLGAQTLGTTFSAMSTGTPNDGNIFDLVHNTANPWTANCSLVGMTAVWLRLHYNDKIFANGLPQISFLMRGKNDIYDPRTSPPTHAYTENAALCIADYLTHPAWGFKAQYGVDVPIAPLIAAANVCDEAVTLAWPVTSPVTTEPRYTCNGGFTLAMKRGDVLKNLLTSCGGRLTYFGGEYIIWPAAWYGVSGAIAGGALLSMAAAGFTWRPTVSISNRFNGVKGTFISPANNWQSSDFPRYAQDADHGYTWGDGPTYDANLDADAGERRWFDIQLPFTISASTAQRLAKIELLRRLNQGTGTLPLNMTGYQFTPMDVLAVDLAFFGWTGKRLEVQDARLKFDAQSASSGSAVLMGVELDVQETDPSIYAWSLGEELSPQGYQQAIVPDTRTPAAPMSFVATSADGAITVTWDAPADAYVLNGGHIEVQYQLVASPAGLWVSMAKMEPTITQADIRGLAGGDQYEIRIRSVNSAGVPSDWVYATPDPITVVAPLAPSLELSFAGSQAQQGVAFTASLIATGGVPAYAYSITSGSLPAGLTLDSATGRIYGTPSTAGTSTFTAEVADSVGTTATLVCTINVTAPSGASVLLAVSTAVGVDLGHGSDVADENRLVSFQVGVTLTFASTPTQVCTIYLSKDGGTNWYGIDWFLWLASGAQIKFPVVRPVSNTTWKVAAVAGTHEFSASVAIATGALPSGAVVSAGFTASGLSLPNANNITALTIDAGIAGNYPYDQTDPVTAFHDWCVKSIVCNPTTARSDPATFTLILTCEDLDASAVSIGPEHIYGTPQVLAEGTAQDFGMLNGPYGSTATPQRSGAIGKVRLRVYCGNRVDQTTEAWRNAAATTLQNLNGVGYIDVVVSVTGASPNTTVAGSRNASTNRAVVVTQAPNAAGLRVVTTPATILIDPAGTGVIDVFDTGGAAASTEMSKNGISITGGGEVSSLQGNGASLCNASLIWDSTGKLTKYANIALQGKGLAHIIWASRLTGQTSSSTIQVRDANSNPLSGLLRVNISIVPALAALPATGGVSVLVYRTIQTGAGGPQLMATSFLTSGGGGPVVGSTVNCNWNDLVADASSMVFRTDGVVYTGSIAGVEINISVTSAWTSASFSLDVVIEKLAD